MTELAERVAAHLIESAEVTRRAAGECAAQVAAAATEITDCFRSGGKLLLCGNGGSAADCQHIAAEFVGLLNSDFDRPGVPAIALTTDTSVLTGYSNDHGFEMVFARQIEALGKAGDVLIAISTSGKSPNVLLAVDAAIRTGIRAIALTGAGGLLAGKANVTISVPSNNTQYIQESLISIEHALCELVEAKLFGTARVPRTESA